MQPHGRISQGVILNKNEVAAEVMSADGSSLSGVFFLSQYSSKHGGPETLMDVMNDAEREFIPFKMRGGVRLLNKYAVRQVHFDSSDIRALYDDPENIFMVGVKVTMLSADTPIVLQGKVYLGDMHPSNRRPVDLLNTPEPFILFYGESQLRVINKKHIVHVDVQKEPTTAMPLPQ